MKYRTLGKTGLSVSIIGVGTHQFSGEWDKKFSLEDVRAILSRARELGINILDTAECYGNHYSEELIGQSLSGARSDWIIVTKFGHQYIGMLETTPAWSAAEVEKQLEISLKKLQTDYIDIYQFHSGRNEDFENEELWEMLQKNVRAGKIRHLGISLSHHALMTDDLHQLYAMEKVGASVIQVTYNRLNQKAEEKIFPFCKMHNVGVIARVPLAKGFLSGKYLPGSTFSSNDIRSKYQSDEANQEQLELVQKIKREEVPPGMNMAEWALSWCLQNDAVATVIPGTKSIEALESNARAAED